MTTITEIVLFSSSASNASAPCEQVIRQYGLPINIVRLDNPSIRDVVRSSSTLQITHLPTLLVNFSDGNIGLFQGQQKTLDWIGKFMKHASSQQEEIPHKHVKGNSDSTHIFEEEGSDDEEAFIPVEPPKKSTGRKPTGRKINFVPIAGPDNKEDKPRGLYDNPEVEDPVVKTGRKKGKRVNKKKGPPVQFVNPDEEDGNEDSPTELIFDPRKKPGKPPAPPTAGLMVGPMATMKPSMRNIKDVAKEMEKQMKDQYGYKENELPRSS